MSAIFSAFLNSVFPENDEDDILFESAICTIFISTFTVIFAAAVLIFGGAEEVSSWFEFCGIYSLPCNTADISSDYGVRVHPITGETKKHTGIDFTPKWHSKIYAVTDGVVYDVSINSAFGSCTTIEHKKKFDKKNIILAERNAEKIRSLTRFVTDENEIQSMNYIIIDLRFLRFFV